MTNLTPERTREQRLAALEVANDVRVSRAKLKHEINDGRRQGVDVLEDVPDEAVTMKVIDLLLALPGVGIVKARKFLSRAEASASKTLGGLSDRQRRALVVQVRAEQARYAACRADRLGS